MSNTAKELLIAAAKSGSIELWQAVNTEVSKRRRASSRLTKALCCCDFVFLLCVTENRSQQQVP